MSGSLRPLIAGNWKMNGALGDLGVLGEIGEGAAEARGAADVLMCLPATLIHPATQRSDLGEMAIGAQDCHAAPSGAHTGDLSAEMLKDAGATAVIVGHSERRASYEESDTRVQAKAEAGLRAGLKTIVCVGETADERQAGLADEVVLRQLKGSLPEAAGDWSRGEIIVAYEPVWAIGTGLTATPDDVAQMHARMRQALSSWFGEAGDGVRLLYGGSVKPDNAAALLAIEDVNGALVGGASLKAETFVPIIEAASAGA
ncbi:MAG: triose-phosphate isomerase [Pseudomonadota bacterium]